MFWNRPAPLPVGADSSVVSKAGGPAPLAGAVNAPATMQAAPTGDTIAPVVRVASAAVVLALLWFASRRVAEGGLAPDALVSLLLYGMLLTQPVAALADVYGQWQSANGAAGRLREAFAQAPEPAGGSRELADPRGEISRRMPSYAIGW